MQRRASHCSASLAWFALLLAAFALRLAGWSWGLPDGVYHAVSLHPDEWNNVRPARAMYQGSTLNPGFYNYGSLYSYLVWLPLPAVEAMGWELTEAVLIRVGRGVTALCSVLTIPVVASMARNLCGGRAAWITALLMATAPGLCLHGGFATVDAPSGLFVALSLRAALLYGQRGQFWHLALSAGCAGLAAATKYPNGIVFLATLAAVWWGPLRGTKIVLVRWSQAAGFAVLAFLIGCPYALLDMAAFWKGASYELFEHSRQGHGHVFDQAGNRWVYLLTSNLNYHLGVVTLWLAILGSLAWRKLERRDGWILLAFGAPFFGMLGLVELRFMRYAVPGLPLLTLAAGALLARWTMRGAGGKVLVGCCLLLHLLPTALQVRGLMALSFHEYAYRYAQEHWRPGETVAEPFPSVFPARLTTPSELGVPVDPSLSLGGLQLERVEESKPDWLFVSELWWGPRSLAPREDIHRFIEGIAASYELRERYSTFPPAWRRVFGPTPAPPDWLYPFLEQHIYHRVQGR